MNLYMNWLESWFLMRSGRDYEPPASDSEKQSPRFLSYFLLPSSYRRQSSESKSPSFKEQNAHIASVKNILESQASYLMSGKELLKLVVFVKGTQFDLVEYLQRKRYGSARLDNFASGLELVGQKVLFDLFHHDTRLWNAYNITLQHLLNTVICFKPWKRNFHHWKI